MNNYVNILTDKPVRSPMEVFQRCQALQALSQLGPAAHAAMPAILRALLVRVDVDCVLALRVAAAEAVWKVGGRKDLALPFLAWALKDEYWGVSREAVRVLDEMGNVAHAATLDLVELAERRFAQGPFPFEETEQLTDSKPEPGSFLAVVATAIGRCGRGVTHWKAARKILIKLSGSPEEDVRSAAFEALDVLGTI